MTGIEAGRVTSGPDDEGPVGQGGDSAIGVHQIPVSSGRSGHLRHVYHEGAAGLQGNRTGLQDGGRIGGVARIHHGGDRQCADRAIAHECAGAAHQVR